MEQIMKFAVSRSMRQTRARCPSLQKFAARLLIFGCAIFLLPSMAISQTWHTEVLDSGSGRDVGQFSAFAVDHDGNLHAVYWDATGNAPRGQLWYAFRAPKDKKWSRMVVDQDGTYVSMALDSNNHPHFAYASKRETGLHYTYWDGATWRKQVIDSGHTNYYNSIQVDAKGHPRISYYLYHLPTGEYSLHLKYAYFDGTSWYIQTVDSRMHTGKMNSLGLDVQGNPYISYSYLAATHDLFYAHFDGSRWQYGAPDLSARDNALLSLGNCIAVDGKGHPHIAYFDNTSNNVKYASWDGSRWTIETVDHVVALDILDHISLKIDQQDRPHLAYYDAGSGMLKYAVHGPRNWEIEVVDHQGNVGLRPSMALDDHDQPFICYYDVTNRALRLAYRESTLTRDVAEKK
jgi:hypothetical protein